MRADKQYNYSKSYSIKHSSKMKAKEQGKKCKHKITRRGVIEEETEVLGVKPLRCLPSGKLIHQTISWDTRVVRDPPSLIYPMQLSAPSSNSNKASRNRVLSSSPDLAIHPIVSAKSLASSSSTKTSLGTLKGCCKCLGYQPLKDMKMERQELRKNHNGLCREMWYNNL